MRRMLFDRQVSVERDRKVDSVEDDEMVVKEGASDGKETASVETEALQLHCISSNGLAIKGKVR